MLSPYAIDSYCYNTAPITRELVTRDDNSASTLR